MALKPTIYKFRIALSDLDCNYFDQLDLTIAMHPSETPERMVTRVLAYCLNARNPLSFSKGLSDPELPDIFSTSLDGRTEIWIDVGEPAPERIKKATHVSPIVKIYCFNSKSDVWWSKEKNKLAKLDIEITQFNWLEIAKFAQEVERTMDLSITISDSRAFLAMEESQLEVGWHLLQANS